MTECSHERLNERGRCVECDQWAVLGPKVPDRVLGVNQHPPVLTGNFKPEKNDDEDSPGST